MAHLWLGYTLLAGGDAVGAEVSFASADAIEMAPMELPAWLALGRAMAALDLGDLPLAQQHLVDAQVYQLDDLRFAGRPGAGEALLGAVRGYLGL